MGRNLLPNAHAFDRKKSSMLNIYVLENLEEKDASLAVEFPFIIQILASDLTDLKNICHIFKYTHINISNLQRVELLITYTFEFTFISCTFYKLFL